MSIHIATTNSSSTPAATGRRIEDLPDLLSIDELSGYLQIPKNTLYFWRSQGTGPQAVAMGKHIRYPRYSVLSWLEQQAAR